MLTIGVDVGGTKTHAIAFDDNFARVAELRVPTPAGGGPAVLSSISKTIAELTDALGPGQIERIGIGIPGRVDTSSGSVSHALNLGIGAQPVLIADQIGRTFGVPCLVENDVNTAALGVHRILHEAENLTDLVYLSIGTGIASGVVLRGRLHRGSRGVAGEIGHLPVVADGRQCGCGLRGCLETVASGPAIARQWPVADGESPASMLLGAARCGDEQANAILTPIADQLATAVYTLALTFDVERIVIGGGVADAGELLLDAILEGVKRLGAQSAFVRSLDLTGRIRITPPGGVGAIGAAALAEQGDTS